MCDFVFSEGWSCHCVKPAQASVGPTRGWEPLGSGWAFNQFVMALISVFKLVISKSFIFCFYYFWLSGKLSVA